MTSKDKCKRLFLVLAVLIGFTLACDGSGNDSVTATPESTATPVIVTGVESADEIIDNTTEAVETAVSAACKACLLLESPDNCTGVCEED